MNVQSMPISPLKVMPLLAALLTALALAGCGSDTTASKSGGDASQPDSSAHEIAAAQASAPAPKADGGIIDVCSLVSLADAESILGTPAKLSEHQPDDKQSSSCNFDSVETQGVNNLGVKIDTSLSDVSEVKIGMAMDKKKQGVETLSGIGDDALVSGDPLVPGNEQPDVGGDPKMAAMLPVQQTLIAIKGARRIQISTNYFGKPRPTDSLKALGKKLAEHL